MITEYNVFTRRKQGGVRSLLCSEKDIRKSKKLNQINSKGNKVLNTVTPQKILS